MSTTPQKVYSELGDNICRLCASDKDFQHFANIFSVTGERKKLPEKISELLNISISEEDGLPSKICRQCDGLLRRFSEFKTMVLETQNELKSKVTKKRCKVFSPAMCEPEKKVRAVEKNRSSARSLFNDDSANSVQQTTVQKSPSEPVTGSVPEEKTSYAILSQAGLRNPEVRLLYILLRQVKAVCNSRITPPPGGKCACF